MVNVMILRPESKEYSSNEAMNATSGASVVLPQMNDQVTAAIQRGLENMACFYPTNVAHVGDFVAVSPPRNKSPFFAID